jgi:hypothetical protein
MSTPPSLNNITVPGGISLHFDTGTGMRDLGEIVPDSVKIKQKTDELRIDSQRSGKLRLMDIISKREEFSLEFTLIDPVIDNLRPFLKGGAVTVVGEGTDAIVDQKATLSGILLTSLGKYGLTAVTVRQFLDKCFVYDGAAYTDRSAEADTLAGTPFTTLTDANDVLYLGKLTPFTEVYFDFAVNGNYGAVVVKYWNGSTWAAVTNLGGPAAALAADGKMYWDLPADWATTIVNSSDAMYWIMITATTPWTTPATINCIRQNAVQNTDYILDPGQVTGGLYTGRVGRLAGGFLADGEEVMVSFTYATWESLKFPIGAADFQQGSARMDFSPDVGLSGKCHIHKCRIKPNGDLDFNPDKELRLPMVLEALDNYAITPTSPYADWEALSES